MSPSVLIIAGAVGLGIMVLIIGLIYERRHQQDKKSSKKSKASTSEQPRSRIYELQMRDHRRSLIWMTAFTVMFIAIGLVEWASFNFQPAWPTTDTHSFNLYRDDRTERRTRRRLYFLTVDYTYQVRDSRYIGTANFEYADAGERDQHYNRLNSGTPVRVWYHPLIPPLGFHYRVGPVFALAMFCIAGLCGLGVVSSIMALISTKIKGGPKQRTEVVIRKGE